ncbi:MAG: alkane 1-monooxygenase, partial [Pseudomonadota bacterium]
MIFVAETKSGETIRYKDTKRYLWLLSLTVPLVPVVSIALYLWLGKQEWLLVLPAFYFYAFIPLMDYI